LSGQSIGGLVLLNLFFLVVGMTVLWSLRGLGTWSEALRLSGLGYILGVASVGVLIVLELLVGIEMSEAQILLTGALLCLVALVAGRAKKRQRPSRVGAGGRLTLVTAVFVALVAVYFEALFRSGRLAGVYEWDAWAFWIPKAKAIYYFGGLDGQFFRALAGQTYPPLVPALEAVAFHFMGSADQVTLHLQFWFFYLGFVGAVVGLLATRVRPLLLWPFILLMLVAPKGGALQAQGDFLRDELLITGALLIGLWLLEREPWQLLAAAIVIGGGLLTKREGYLIAGCVFGAALVTAQLGKRPAWKPLLAAGAVAVGVSIPWIVWFREHGFGGGGPAAGGFGLFDHFERAWPSFRLAVSTFFDFHIFLLTPALCLFAVMLALLSGARMLAGYVSSALALGIAAFTWITWSFPEMPITKNGSVNPIVRVTASLVILAAVFTPLLLQAAWDGGGRTPARLRRPAGKESWSWRHARS
jgi:hypothetical protein